MANMIMECIDKFYYIEFCHLIEQYINKLKTRNIVIFGAGIMGIQLSYVLKNYGLNVYAFSDNDSNKWGKKWGEFFIVKPQQLVDIDDVFIFLTMERFEDCKLQLEKMGYIQYDNLIVVAEGIADKYVEDFKKKSKAKTLILGDCTLNVISLCEEEKESLFERFDRNTDVKVLAQNGTYMRFYYHILQMAIRNMKTLNKVFLMFSVDIFSNQYHLLPANQHKKVLDKICAISGETSSELFDFKREVEIRNKGNAINFSAPNRSIQDVKKISQELRNHTMINYLYQMRKENESLQYLNKFIRLCHENDIECICILMPVNYELGLNIFSCDFIEKYERNKAEICTCILKERGLFCDLSYLLRMEQFMAIRSSNEGIFSKGRNAIYDRIRMYL